MNPYKYLVVLLLMCCAMCAQTTIPYRDGAKWGLTDTHGQMVVPVKYDSLQMGSFARVYQDVITYLNGKKGFIKNGTEVLEPVFDDITHEKGILATYRQTASGREIYLFNDSGKPIINGPLTAVKAHDKMGYAPGGQKSDVHFFHVVKPDLTESFFTYNTQGEGALAYVFKDAYSIAYEREHNGYLVVRVRQKETDPLQLKRLTYNRAEGIFEVYYPTHLPEQFVVEHDFESDFRDNSLGVIADPGDPMIDAGGYATGPGGDIAIPMSSDLYREPAKKKKNINLKKDGNGLNVLVWADNGKPKTTVAGFQPKEFTIQNGQGNIVKGDSIFKYYTYVQYKSKGKWGIYLGQANFKPKEFDTLFPVRYRDGSESNTAFIVGNRNKAKQYTYGIMRFDGSLSVPLSYDDIKVYNRHGASTLTYLAVKKGSKYGLLNPDGTTVLATEYDSINQPAASGQGVFYLETMQAGKYGLYVVHNKEVIVLPPVFKYRIQKVLDYAVTTGDKGGSIKLLVVLKDDKGRVAGYADETGKLYFKD